MKTELAIPSDLKFLAVVEDWLLNSLKAELGNIVDLDWKKVESRLRLVIVEVYSNIVRHAHHDRPEIPVILRLGVEGSFLCLEVWDQGRGFDIRSYRAPIPSEHQEGGYGWLILHQLMDRVDYQLMVGEGRNCLTLEKDLGIGLPQDYTK
ncbi:ATP-binding protein [Leptothoe kymatousa]|uniref:ATP-binding protein n=1 Tax=Leptothoe kymatousa TAU-MAC 1615 TaxID=2364775 RepID=A0ABS5Y235_9CYAN|nr:ATP-binding protein [Leptothoe kymatousa]MBT9311886.1 ATP-binding protein [Leptothoe kymatousa TAU-MAC 1615]